MQRDTMELTESDRADLKVTHATATPLWKGLATLIKYRTTRNYKSAEFLGARIVDKVVMTLIFGTLYLGIGDKMQADNYINIGAVLFMWCIMPACASLDPIEIHDGGFPPPHLPGFHCYDFPYSQL